MELLLPIVAVVVGLVGLVFGADRFVLGAATLARRMGVSPLVVGMLIVGIGTSAPEMLVSGIAAYQGTAGMAVGNALGSNIANVGLVLGAAALISPIETQRTVYRTELPILVGITLLGYVLIVFDGRLGRIDALILLGTLGLVVYRMFRVGGSGSAQAAAQPAEAAVPLAEVEAEAQGAAEVDAGAAPSGEMSSGASVAWLVVGLALLLVCSRAVVWGATEVATYFEVSDLVIGLTVVAIGTSLPELAAAVASAFRGEHDLAVGNVIGSNTFNLLTVLPVPGLVRPDAVEQAVLVRDYPVMGGFTLLLWAMAFGVRATGKIQRWEGAVLLLGFFAYMTYIGLQAGG